MVDADAAPSAAVLLPMPSVVCHVRQFGAKLHKKSEIGKFSGEILLMPNTISANGRNLRMPDDISANGRNLKMPDDISANGGNLRICFRRAERGDDEATKSAIELVGCCTEELGIGASWVLACGFGVLEITVLPIGETVGIRHLRLAEVDGLRESADSTFAALGKRSSIWIKDCVRVRTTITSAHDDTFFG